MWTALVSQKSTVRFWFQRFRSGNFDLQNQPRGRPETKVENEELKAYMEADPSQRTLEIAAGILNRIITCDEKWILYDNRKRSSQWLNPGDPAKSCPKRKFTQKKLLVSVWWTSAASQTITADIYCQQMQTIKEELAAKQPRLVNRSRPLLLHDNARPNTAQQTTTKLDELQLECDIHHAGRRCLCVRT
ncbi:hypothetical protein ABMA27_008639 [Loxostege sticticalis]|uniref:Transposase n=1 Tax=Loxostege sticticalis TaxID=481309 RepID=A0ABR3HCK2_LOXSC